MKRKKVSIYNYIDRSMLLSVLDEVAKASTLATFIIEPGVEMPTFSNYSAFPPLCRLVKVKTQHQCDGCYEFIKKMVHDSVLDQKIHTCPMNLKFTASPIVVGKGVARAVIVCGFARFEPFSDEEYEKLIEMMPQMKEEAEYFKNIIDQVPIVTEKKMISIEDYLQHSCITVMKNYMVRNNSPSGNVEHELAMMKKKILSMRSENIRIESPVSMKDEKELVEAIVVRNRPLAMKRSQRILEKLFQEEYNANIVKFWVMELGVIICNAPLFGNSSKDLNSLHLNHLVDIPSKSDMTLTKVQLWFNKLIERVMDHMDIVNNPDKTSSNYRVRLAIDYINSQQKSKMTAGDVSKYVAVSQQHLNRLFQKEVGMSLAKYIMNVKLEEGKQLLVDSDMIVAEIAEELEFYDVAHFSRNFKKNFSLSPAQYRERYRNRSDLSK